MRIILTAHAAKIGGGLHATKQIMSALLRVAPMHQYLLVYPEGSGFPAFEGNDNIQVLTAPAMSSWKRIFLWDRTVLKEAVRHFQPDWIWNLLQFIVPFSGYRQSLFFRNSFYVYPIRSFAENLTFSQKCRLIFERYYFGTQIRKANRVYCQTEVIKKRFVDLYRFPENRVGLCPMSASHFARPAEADISIPKIITPFLNRFKLLALSTYYPHKNYRRIVDMYDKYRKELADTVCFLTLDTRKSPVENPESNRIAVEKLMDRVQKLKLDHLIVNAGYLNPAEVPAFFQHTDALFLPTLLETFCNPFMEAMQMERPIITSDLDFTHPVCGDAALYVDPYSLESMKDGILRLTGDAELRKSLVKNAEERKNTHIRSWEDILRDVLDQEGIEHV